uniref:GPI inositol-deacylase n=1 Tax=Cicer arietinum TaxID=3827 RepID=A0A3Q7YB19_CICAR|nr:uncharacterized protein LOC101492958 [Cicer arietinum]
MFKILAPVSLGFLKSMKSAANVAVANLLSFLLVKLRIREKKKSLKISLEVEKYDIGIQVMKLTLIMTVRSLAAESDRAYQNGPLEHTFNQVASLIPKGDVDISLSSFESANQYTSRLDWFTVDLEGEHSAMDADILEEHAKYVVYAIHKILDQYNVSYDARTRDGAANSGSSPKSVILVGHSMGGFVARAAVIHPHLRKSAVQTILTLSFPHQSPPVALQPSLGHYFARVNSKWREGYEVQTTNTGRYVSGPVLSDVVVVSISGAYTDYQVRSTLASLDNIVPPTHGFMISSTGMNNVWLSMEHQAILWCNQLVAQVSHTLLSLIDAITGQPFSDSPKRLAVFARMLHSGISHNFNRMMQLPSSKQSINIPVQNTKDASELRGHTIVTSTSVYHYHYAFAFHHSLQTQGSNGKSHFVLVTNLEPCSGIRLHLWPENGKSASSLPLTDRVMEVTSKMMRIPLGPATRQLESGSQTEQPPPSAVFWLGPENMHGFRFLTISVAPRPVQYQNYVFVIIIYFSYKSFAHRYRLVFQGSANFPSVALAWDDIAGFHIYPNLNSETIFVDSSPAQWSSPQQSEKTVVLLLVDPHCSYKSSISISVSVAASRLLLLYIYLMLFMQIIGLSIAVVFFALMQQAHSWDLNQRIPSMLTDVEFNLTLMSRLFPLAVVPIIIALFISFSMSQPFLQFASFTSITLICYIIANDFIAILILISWYSLWLLLHIFASRQG